MNITTVSDPGAGASRWVSLGFVIAGLVNFSILILSQGLTSQFFSALFPALFSWAGIVAVLLWGLAYISVAQTYHRVPELVAIFAIEKCFYAGTWFFWIQQQGDNLSNIFRISPLSGLFYSVYGPLDFCFGLFFAGVFIYTSAPHSKA